MSGRLIFGIAMLAAGLLIMLGSVVYGFILIQRGKKLAQASQKGRAEILRMNEAAAKNNMVRVSMRIRYSAGEAGPFETTVGGDARPSQYRAGENIDIIYEEGNPKNVGLPNNDPTAMGKRYILSGGFLVLVCVILAVVFWFLLRSRG